jgi:predicted kinase
MSEGTYVSSARTSSHAQPTAPLGGRQRSKALGYLGGVAGVSTAAGGTSPSHTGSRRQRTGSVPTMTLLVVFAGLTGSGKSVLTRGVADALGATYLRIDTIESAIVSTLVPFRDNPVGYVVAGQVAADQLIAGRDVVADAVNGVAAARAGWLALAARTGAALRFVEVRCSDAAEHRRRVQARRPEMPGHGVPSWTQVQRRRYEPWPPELSGRLVVDNIGDPAGHVAGIVSELSR